MVVTMVVSLDNLKAGSLVPAWVDYWDDLMVGKMVVWMVDLLVGNWVVRKVEKKAGEQIDYGKMKVKELKTLLDHLRVVNVKLNGDLKNAHLEGMRCKSLEHRVKLSEQDETALRKRIEALEAQVQQKEHELLEALEAAREQVRVQAPVAWLTLRAKHVAHIHVHQPEETTV